jgi:type II secretory pathway pseudopilin PulG
MTLVEVVVGLVILGTLVASVAIARGRALRQYARADVQLRATRAADTMLAAWFNGSPDSIPLRGTGPLIDVPGCVWRTIPTRSAAAETMGAFNVRFEIYSREPGPPLLSIEFVVPRRLSTTAPTTRSSQP